MKNKKFGFHGHNNQQLAFSNTIQAIINHVDYLDGSAPPAAEGADGAVWLAPADGEKTPPRPVPVKVLLNNGSLAAVEPIQKGALAEGARVVVREEAAAEGKAAAPSSSGDSGSKNPFMPNMPKPPKGARGGPPPG